MTGTLDTYDNAYSSPEKLRLENVAQIDYSDGNYCFDYRVIWKHLDTGLLYTARDAGCSCPSPFEDYRTLESLTRFALSEIEAEAKKEAASSFYSGDQITPFLEAIRKLDNEPRAKVCPAGQD